MPSKIAIWHLSISSFSDIVPGATHFHGRLCPPLADEKASDIHLEREMTAREIQQENKSNRDMGYTIKISRGAKTSAFNSEEELIQHAKTVFVVLTSKLNANDAILLLGNPCVASPQRPLHAKPLSLCAYRDLMRIWLQWEAIDGWDGSNKPVADRLDREWDTIMQSISG